MMTPMKTLTNKKTNKTYEVIDERARIEIEKLKLLTGTEAVENSWEYFNTYIPSGDDSGFNYDNLIKCREVRFVGKLKFASGCNVSVNFRTEFHQSSAYHKTTTLANFIQSPASYYQIEAYIRRIEDDKVVIEAWLDVETPTKVPTNPETYHRYIYTGEELAENLAQFGITCGGGVKIIDGYVDVYTRGVVE